MWNTNKELENKLHKLEKEFERFSQNLEPRSGSFEWQMWYDRINEKVNTWDWLKWNPIGWWDKFFTTYTTHSWSWNKTITCWFRPRFVFLFTMITTWTDQDFTRSWITEDDDQNLTVTTEYWTAQYASLWTWDNSTIQVIYLNSWTDNAKMWSFSDTWFTLTNVSLSVTAWIHVLAIW